MNLVDYYRTNQVYGVEPDERMRRMLAVVKAKGAHRVLDVGCGRGLFPSELHRLGAQAYGIDVFDPNSIAADGWVYTGGDITCGLPYPDGGVDCVTLGEVIEHVPVPDELLCDIRRVLGQGSRAQGHLKVFTHRSLAEILELHGFQVHERRGLPFVLPWPARLVDVAYAGWVSLASILLYVARRS